MTTATDDKILDRIAKLLELASSPNENEATSAAEKAQALLLKHGLEMADVAGRLDGPGVSTEHHSIGGSVVEWRRALAGVVADGCGGVALIERPHGTDTGQITFYGPRGTTKGTAQLYRTIADRLERFANVDSATLAARQGSDPDAYRTAYLWAALERLADRFDARKRAAERDHNPGALVLVTKAADEAMREQHPDVETEEHKPELDDVAGFIAGARTGSELPLGDTELRKTPDQLKG